MDYISNKNTLRAVFLDLSFSLNDESLEDSDNLPAPEILAHEIVENLGVALEQFESIVEELESPTSSEWVHFQMPNNKSETAKWKKTLVKEWIVLIGSITFGLIIPPSVLKFIFDSDEFLPQLISFYRALLNAHDSDFKVLWVIVLFPYFLLQIVRVTIWSIKQLKEKS